MVKAIEGLDHDEIKLVFEDNKTDHVGITSVYFEILNGDEEKSNSFLHFCSSLV